MLQENRTTGRGGDVLIYSREYFKCVEYELNMNLECLGPNVILLPNMNFNIVVLYNPPSHGTDFYNQLKSLLSICDKCNKCILFGDFNINWMEKSEKSKPKLVMEKFTTFLKTNMNYYSE